MDLKQLVHRPKLVKVEITDTDIMENYGEPIIFWMEDYIDIITYFDFYRSQSQNDPETFQKIMRKILLDENGQHLLNEGEVLPIDVTLSILGKVNDILGKSKTRPSMSMNGER